MLRRAWTLFSLVTATAALGCGNPCDDLAGKICSCKATHKTESTCRSQVENDPVQDTTEAQEARCAELVDTCSCKALERGDWAACGLAAEPSAPAGAIAP